MIHEQAAIQEPASPIARRRGSRWRNGAAISHVPRQTPRVDKPEDAKSRADAIEAFLQAHPNCPKAAEGTAYVEYLRHAGDAMSDKGTWQTALAGFFDNPLLNDLEYMQVSLTCRAGFSRLGDVENCAATTGSTARCRCRCAEEDHQQRRITTKRAGGDDRSAGQKPADKPELTPHSCCGWPTT